MPPTHRGGCFCCGRGYFSGGAAAGAASSAAVGADPGMGALAGAASGAIGAGIGLGGGALAGTQFITRAGLQGYVIAGTVVLAGAAGSAASSAITDGNIGQGAIIGGAMAAITFALTEVSKAVIASNTPGSLELKARYASLSDSSGGCTGECYRITAVWELRPDPYGRLPFDPYHFNLIINNPNGASFTTLMVMGRTSVEFLVGTYPKNIYVGLETSFTPTVYITTYGPQGSRIYRLPFVYGETVPRLPDAGL
jgi:hypothetical protein